MNDTIYVVDDDALNLKMISKILQSAGYGVEVAQSGAEALAHIGAARPSLAILDVMMPDIDGYELCRRLHAQPETAKIPVIMLTALTAIDERLKSFDAGADDFIPKPFQPLELLARIKVLLRRFARYKESPAIGLQAETTAFFSLRGGVGVSTLAVNFSIGIAQVWGASACLVDMGLLAGQDALMLDIPARNSWADLAEVPAHEIDADMLQQILLPHESGLRVLASPKRVEDAEKLGVEQVQRVFNLLKGQFDYLIFDLPRNLDPQTIAALDAADRIALLLAPELSSIRCASIALDVFQKFNYPPEKTKLLLNWTFNGKGLARAEIEKAIKRKIDIVLPHMGDALVQALTQGKPPAFHEPSGAMGALFEDLAYHWGKQNQNASEAQLEKEGYKRALERARARQKK